MNDSLRQRLLQKIEQLEHDIRDIKDLLTADTDSAFAEPTTQRQSSHDPLDLLTALFTVVQQDLDEEACAIQLRSLLHSSISEHPIALDNFTRFSFKTFKARWADYLQRSADPSSFTITRKQENNRGELALLTYYLHVNHRSPTPITVKQDPQDSLHWKISALSL